jgi:hypothetical protein
VAPLWLAAGGFPAGMRVGLVLSAAAFAAAGAVAGLSRRARPARMGAAPAVRTGRAG